MELACLQGIQNHLSQASNMPFLQQPLYNLVGPLGITSFCDQVLQGIAEPPMGTPYHAELVLKGLCRPSFVPASSQWTFLLEDHIEGWTKARESTSSSPSGIHFGHYMAAAQDREVAQVDYEMARLPYKTGYSPLR